MRAFLVSALTLSAFLPALASGEDAAPVRIVRAQPAETTEVLRLTGTVTAKQRARLSPRISGLVAEVHVDAGDRVGQGDVLLDLDRKLAGLEVRATRAAVDEARTRLAEARRIHEEALKLVEENHIPETEVQARAAAVQQEAATVERLSAEAQAQAERVERHSVVAPFDGVVVRRLTAAGEWVETGTPVLELVSMERLRLDVRAPQERYARIFSSTPVTVRLDGRPGASYPGRVIAKVPVNDPAARTFLVRVEVDAPEGDLIPGMSASAHFALAGEDAAVLVPRDAIVRAPDGTHRLWVVEGEDGSARAVQRRVRIGQSLREDVEVLDGLDANRRVIVRGNETLRDGQAVRVLDGEAP